MLGKKSAKKKVKFQTGKKSGKWCHGFFFYVEAAHVSWSWIFVLLMQGIFMLCILLFCDQAFSLLLNVPLLYSFI